MEPQPVNNSKLILTIVITALLTTLVVGGGVFVWQQGVKQQEIQQAVEKVKQELAQKGLNSTPQPASNTEGDNLGATYLLLKGPGIYQNARFHYSLAIPEGYTVESNEQNATSASEIQVFKSSLKGGSMWPQFDVRIYKNIKHDDIKTWILKHHEDLVIRPKFTKEESYGRDEGYWYNPSQNPVEKVVNGQKYWYFDDEKTVIIGYPFAFYFTEKNENIYELTYPLGDEENFGQIFRSFTFIEPQTSIDTSNWKTYRSENYGFEFKYPASFNFSQGLTQTSTIRYGGKEESLTNDRGILSLEIQHKKLDPSNIEGIYGKPNSLTKINIGNHQGYQYGEGDAGCSGTVIQTALQDNILLVGFTSCEGNKEPLLINDTSLIAQILSTFKFTQ